MNSFKFKIASGKKYRFSLLNIFFSISFFLKSSDGDVMQCNLFDTILQRLLLKIFNLGIPEILRINDVLNLNNVNKTNGNELIR
jgi:hypothetical protein